MDLSKYKLPANADLYAAICEFIWYESPELFRSTGFMAELGGKNDSYIIGLNCSYIYDKPEDFVNDYNKIEKDLETLTDIMQEAFMDTIKLDEVNERIKSMNEQLNRHLDRLSAK